jgi:hypothetical protein
MGMPYAVMGGLAVRVYGLPRPEHDIGFTLTPFQNDCDLGESIENAAQVAAPRITCAYPRPVHREAGHPGDAYILRTGHG